MEDNRVLDLMNKNHLYAFHYIFIPVITNALQILLEVESHSISTSNAKTPMHGMIRNKQGGVKLC